MFYTVYLDQNVLTELRSRKLASNPNASNVSLIKKFCSSEGIQLVYSIIHLDEIYQISNKEMQFEHINLLENLKAKYLEPNYILNLNQDPSNIWYKYLETKESNHHMGIAKILDYFEKTSRKLYGLKENNSFEELHQAQQELLIDLINYGSHQLDSLEPNILDKSNIYQYKQYFANLKDKVLSQENPLPIDNSENFGLSSFRRLDIIKNIKIQSLNGSEVIEKIVTALGLGKSNTNTIEDILGQSINAKIIGLYSLMNFAGYYADNVLSTKNNKDRFKASGNDAMHASYAHMCNLLISQDKAFIKKVRACYDYLDVKTAVITMDDFIHLAHTLES
jgi:hypothetical protein